MQLCFPDPRHTLDQKTAFFTYIRSIFIGVILTALLDMMFSTEFLFILRFPQESL